MLSNMTRDQWLNLMCAHLRSDFERAGFPFPTHVRVTCGWPSTGARSGKRLGEAWSQTASAGNVPETFISPILSDSVQVLGVLVHELCHHAVGCDHGHGHLFRNCALAVGLEGKMTATTVSASLFARLDDLVHVFGRYPHQALIPPAHANKQTTRLLRIECGHCGCLARMTKKAIADAGLPTCGCGGAFQCPDFDPLDPEKA